jgi:GTPase SAR1 family protein
MEEVKIYKLAIVGDAGVGKKTLLNNCYKHLNFQEKGKGNAISENKEYLANLQISGGIINLNIIIVNNISESFENVDCAIIMSDISDANMTLKFKELYEELTSKLGFNLKIINCFNKIDIKDKATYIFDTALPSFDISAKNNIGAIEMLMFALKIMTYS